MKRIHSILILSLASFSLGVGDVHAQSVFHKILGKVGIKASRETSSDTADSPASRQATRSDDPSVAYKVSDDEPAYIHTKLSAAEVTRRLKTYFFHKDMEPKVDADTGTLTTDYGMNRHCGPGFYRCEDKVQARISADGGGSVIRLRVIQRKHESGMNTKPWKEENKSNGKDTSSLAAEFDALLNGGTATTAAR
jgi:hypothetical protein